MDTEKLYREAEEIRLRYGLSKEQFIRVLEYIQILCSIV